MIEQAVAQLKRKKLFKIDGILLCLVKDMYVHLKLNYNRLIRIAIQNGMPKAWKLAGIE